MVRSSAATTESSPGHSARWRSRSTASPSMSTLGRIRSSQAGDLPGALAEDRHERGDQRHPHQERVDRDAGGEAEGDRLERRVALGDEGHEHREHDESCRRDDLRRSREAAADSAQCGGATDGTVRMPRLRVVHEVLAHPRHQEDLVVHGEPNSTPIRMIGMKLMIGPTFATCRASANQPHSNTAPTMPNAATIESRYPAAAVSGTQSERKTMVSRISDRPITKRPKGRSALPSWSEMSMPTAVKPVTLRSMPNSSSHSSWCERSSRTRSAVAGHPAPSRGRPGRCRCRRSRSGSRGRPP